MFTKIDMTSDTPIYQQLMENIIRGIAKQELISGTKLPSVRTLADELEVNMHTVAKAYTLLKDKGFLSVHRNKGAVVNPQSKFAADSIYFADLRNRLITYSTEAACRGVKAGEWISVCNDAYEELSRSNDFM